MITPSATLSLPEKQLIKLFKALRPEDREALLKFAEFLKERGDSQPAEDILDPKPIPRPESETVIAAIQRLSATYPMLDKSAIFHETSALMTQHVLQGREAVTVIDELEELFAQHYRRMLSLSSDID